MDKINTRTINRILCFSLLVFSISIIFFVSKYVGIVSFFWRVVKALIPVFIAVFLSFMLEPLIGFFLNRGIKRKYGVLLSYGIVILAIVGILYFTIPSFVDQLSVFIGNVPELLEDAIRFFDNIGINADKDKIGNYFNAFFIEVSKKVITYVGLSISVLFNVILGISGAIFLSFDFPKFRNGIKARIPNRIKTPTIYYFKKFLPFVHKYFLGMFIDSMLIFIISVIGFSIIGIEYILVISLFITVTNLIPIIGPYIGGVPALIIGFSSSSSLGFSALIVVVIVQIIESNIMQPLILKNTIKLHPLEGILGISLFGALFGVLGMILSPIIIVSIKLLFLPYGEKENVFKGMEK